MKQNAIASLALIAMLGITGAAAEGHKKASAKRVDISVTEEGFTPAKVTVKQNEEVTLTFTRKTDNTCAKEVVVYVDDKNKIERDLPLNQAVPVTVTFPNSGEIRYACGMGMYAGVIVVQ